MLFRSCRFTYLTDALERIFSRDRVTENRKAQVAAHSKYGSASGDLGNSGGTAAAAKGNEKGRGKGKGKDKGKSRAESGQPGAGGTPVPKGLENIKFCRAFAQGTCLLTADECKKQKGYSHLSRQQLTTMLGFDPFRGQYQSGGSQSDNEGKGKGKGGQGKTRGRGKANGKASPAADGGEEALSAAAELQRMKSKQIACAAFQKGACKKGEQCQFAHLDADAAAEVKRASAAWKKAETARRSASSERTSS